jgi:hypothetical protein
LAECCSRCEDAFAVCSGDRMKESQRRSFIVLAEEIDDERLEQLRKIYERLAKKAKGN